MVNSINLAGIPNLNIAKLERAQKRYGELKLHMYEQLKYAGYPEVACEYISDKVLMNWFEILHQQNVDDINGVPLNIQMLPLTMSSTEVIREAFANVQTEMSATIAPEGLEYIEHCWTQLRGDLIMTVFDGLDHDQGVDFAIELNPSVFLIPSNDEAAGTPPLRMFSSIEAAHQYAERGWEQFRDE